MPNQLRDFPLSTLGDIRRLLASRFPAPVPTPAKLGTEQGRMELARDQGRHDVIAEFDRAINVIHKEAKPHDGIPQVPESA